MKPALLIFCLFTLKGTAFPNEDVLSSLTQKVGQMQSLQKASGEIEAEIARVKSITDVAAKLPPGPERDALLDVATKGMDAIKKKVSSEEAKLEEIRKESYLDLMKVEDSGNWALAEVKKPYLKDVIGEEVALKDGRVVKRDSVTTLSPSGLKWIGDRLEDTHWSNLPDTLVATYGWTKERQEKYESWKSVAGRVALKAVEQERERAMQAQNASVARAKIEGTRVAVSLRVNQALEKGCLCYGTRIERSPAWSGWVGMLWVEGVPPAEEHDEPIYVVGLPATTVDGDKLAGWLYPCGVYRYTAVSGAAKAVRRYATSAKLAETLLDE